jgi:hypothetical protein
MSIFSQVCKLGKEAGLNDMKKNGASDTMLQIANWGKPVEKKKGLLELAMEAVKGGDPEKAAEPYEGQYD